MKIGDRIKSVYTGNTGTVCSEVGKDGHVSVLMDNVNFEQKIIETALEVIPKFTPKFTPAAPSEVRVTDPNTGGQKGSKPEQPAQIPPRFLLALGQHFGEGQIKYPDAEPGRPNWSRGYAWSLSANALERHLLAWLAGEDYDEDGRHNLVAVAWHASVLYTFQTEALGTDDRPAYYKGGTDV